MYCGREYDFGWLERSLYELGFRLVFCIRAPETFPAARAERIRVSGNPSQYDDIQLFIAEQEQMTELVEESVLPSLRLDVSDDDIPKAVNAIADWLAQTGSASGE
jgi:hypothetical protein